jgi:Flp pilus assembly protein CpaB
MKPKTMILMGLAITCGLGASYMTSRLLAERQPPEEVEKVEILVASKNLSVHQRITNPEDLFEKKLVTRDNEPPDAIKDYNDLKGKTLKQGRMKGDHITPALLYDKGQLEIPEKHQAVGLRVNIETSAAGLASLPGSKVNLLLSMPAQNPLDTKTMLLLENVLVLAADIRTDREGERAAPAQVVTFALKDEDILTVTNAKRMGEITMVLRNSDDSSTMKVRETDGQKVVNRNKQKVDTVQIEEQPAVVQKAQPQKSKEPERPRLTKHYYEIVQGADIGPRTVERVYYYRSTADGRILTAGQAEELQRQPADKGSDKQDFE